jgi:hypothetical protein
MFRLQASVKRGSASNFKGTWVPYATLEAARAEAQTLLREERVVRVTIVRDEVPPAFVEWVG